MFFLTLGGLGISFIIQVSRRPDLCSGWAASSGRFHVGLLARACISTSNGHCCRNCHYVSSSSHRIKQSHIREGEKASYKNIFQTYIEGRGKRITMQEKCGLVSKK